MVPQFEVLNQEEKDLMFDTIMLITLLIAFADGEMDDKERSFAEKITHIRSYNKSLHESLHEYLQEFYKIVEDNFQEKLDNILKTLPEDNDERLAEISKRLSRLNSILPKLDQVFAWEYYKGLLSFAKRIAKASGGFLGWSSISKSEQDLVGLHMINPVVLKEESED